MTVRKAFTVKYIYAKTIFKHHSHSCEICIKIKKEAILYNTGWASLLIQVEVFI